MGNYTSNKNGLIRYWSTLPKGWRWKKPSNLFWPTPSLSTHSIEQQSLCKVLYQIYCLLLLRIFKMNITQAVVSFFVAIGMIPGGRNVLKDRVCLVGWVLVTICLSVLFAIRYVIYHLVFFKHDNMYLHSLIPHFALRHSWSKTSFFLGWRQKKWYFRVVHSIKPKPPPAPPPSIHRQLQSNYHFC